MSTTKKSSKKKTPWPRRRELDIDRILDILDRNIELIGNVPADALKKHGLDQDEMVTAYEELRETCKDMRKGFAVLPDKFPPKGTRAVKARAAFSVGAKVRIRAKRVDEYEGIFGEHVKDEFKIVGELRKNFVPIQHPAFGDNTYYPSKAHVEVVQPVEDE